MPKGILYIVSTPIGNLEDITLRALRVLREADAIAAEDTRHTMKLLSHYAISKPLLSYWGEKEKERAEETLRLLEAGKSVALVTDAGTPGVSDPGSVLVSRAVQEGITVLPVPGPSSVTAALSVSGFYAGVFLFAGFLPPRRSQRRKALEDLGLERKTLVFFEAPHRFRESLSDMAEILGERRAVVVREITKLHEEIIRGTLPGLAGRVEDTKEVGEFVIVVEGKGEEKGISMEEALLEVAALIKKGIGRKEAVKRIAGEYGLRKKELYDLSLGCKNESS